MTSTPSPLKIVCSICGLDDYGKECKNVVVKCLKSCANCKDLPYEKITCECLKCGNKVTGEWEEKYKPFRGFIPKCWDCSKKERLEEEKKKAIRNKLNVLSDTKLTNAQYLTIVPNSNNPLMQAKIGFPELSQN